MRLEFSFFSYTLQRVFICTQLTPFEMNCAGQRNHTCTRILLSIWSLRKSKKRFLDIQLNTHPCYMFNWKCITIQVFKGNFLVTNVWYLYELNKKSIKYSIFINCLLITLLNDYATCFPVHVFLLPGSEVNNAFLSLKFSHSAKGMKYA